MQIFTLTDKYVKKGNKKESNFNGIQLILKCFEVLPKKCLKRNEND